MGHGTGGRDFSRGRLWCPHQPPVVDVSPAHRPGLRRRSRGVVYDATASSCLLADDYAAPRDRTCLLPDGSDGAVRRDIPSSPRSWRCRHHRSPPRGHAVLDASARSACATRLPLRAEGCGGRRRGCRLADDLARLSPPPLTLTTLSFTSSETRHVMHRIGHRPLLPLFTVTQALRLALRTVTLILSLNPKAPRAPSASIVGVALRRVDTYAFPTARCCRHVDDPAWPGVSLRSLRAAASLVSRVRIRQRDARVMNAG